LLTHHAFAGTDLIPRRADSVQSRIAIISTADPFVEATVTVIVFTVADLLAGLLPLVTDQVAVFTARSAYAADPVESGVASHPAAGVHLVDAPVAVIVQAVT